MRVGIVGATGYTGFELIKILLRHGKASINVVTSESFSGKKFSDVYPQMKNIFDDILVENDFELVADRSDVVFLCLPHSASMDAVKYFYDKGKYVIDLSADFRYSDSDIYEKVYGLSHRFKDLCKKAIYGIPELFQNMLKGAKLVANPGCYPTSAIIPLYPLLREGLIDDEIIIDSKSGVSGAGRKPSEKTHFCEVDEDFKPYGVLFHRHESEISFVLNSEKITFTPHLLPIIRGIESTIYTKSKNSLDDLLGCWKKYYGKSYFVRIYESGVPAVKNVINTNFVDIALFKRNDRVVIVSCIDNLIKGASGQAVQNMNVMLGFDEKEGLI